ncbi:hypothetical protein EI94DRAFT_1721809 [Lactarius quietus]|nr:hypothetical protein EI94DRAFT_1721809 [Lactarius quietus]
MRHPVDRFLVIVVLAVALRLCFFLFSCFSLFRCAICGSAYRFLLLYASEGEYLDLGVGNWVVGNTLHRARKMDVLFPPRSSSVRCGMKKGNPCSS